MSNHHLPRCLLLSLAASACVTYDFEPVVPFALAQTTQRTTVTYRGLKPNLMLVVDKSRSMSLPIEATDSRCPPGCGTADPCPPQCPTRISELRNAMNTFLTTSGADARMGLVFFPSDLTCGAPVIEAQPLPPPTTGDADTDASLAATAATINAKIQKETPLGGTPTAPSLAFAGTRTGLLDVSDNRQDYILLLTDGLPNCNTSNVKNMCGCSGSECATKEAACRCTQERCDNPTNCARGCLDLDEVVKQTQGNKNKGIKTIVVGFGADTQKGDANMVLNAIAVAGQDDTAGAQGFARRCPNGLDSECGRNNTCVQATKLCANQFYQADNASQLSEALQNIIGQLKEDPCVFRLQAPPDSKEFLAVIVNDKNVPHGPTTWSYSAGSDADAGSATGAGALVFTGEICSKLRASTNVTPVSVEVRIVQTL